MSLNMIVYLFFFFFKQKTAYEMRISDWSSDVCSSDLAAIDPRSPGRVELGVLDVEHADPLVINVDELQIVERLQHIMAGIIEDVGARMIVDAREEAFEGHPVVQILAEIGRAHV